MIQETTASLIADFVVKVLAQCPEKRPLFIGLNGPQGSGKTTATRSAVELLAERHHLRGIAISIDDFYLTREAQVKLAEQFAPNPYLKQRGYPGTHDIRLGSKKFAELSEINAAPLPVLIPRYDKSLHDGEGDRCPEAEGTSVSPPLDFVILEGWCVGFTPVEKERISDANLLQVNALLAAYSDWYRFLDALIQLRAENIHDTVRWRIEAEQNMRAQGKAGMSDERISAYIGRFLPAYDLYLPQLEKKPPKISPRLVIDIGSDRGVIGTQQF